MKLKYQGKNFFGLFERKLTIVLAGALMLVFILNPGVVLAQTVQPKIFFFGAPTPLIGYPGGNLVTAQVRLSNFSIPSGLGAFLFKVKFDPNLVTVIDTNSDGVVDSDRITSGTFLASSGKQVVCSDGFIDPDQVDATKKLLTYSCVTTGLTPSAPTGSGILATIKFTTKNRLGNTSLILTSTELVENTLNSTLVPHTVGNISLLVVKCGDFDRNTVVNLDDILAVANRYGQSSTTIGWDAKYDLDGNNFINIDDILDTSYQYGPVKC